MIAQREECVGGAVSRTLRQGKKSPADECLQEREEKQERERRGQMSAG